MRTRSQSRNSNRQQQQVNPTFVEPFNLVKPIPAVTMDDTRTMAQLLEVPTVGYEDAIVVPEITADNFELKHGLLTLIQNKQFFGHDKEDPHAHIRYFNKITSTMKFPNVPSTSVKLMLFPFSLEGGAWIWLEKEPPRSILTWDDLVAAALVPKEGDVADFRTKQGSKELGKLLLVVVAWSWSCLFTWLHEKWVKTSKKEVAVLKCHGLGFLVHFSSAFDY
ncbi:hypothetical protein Tco_0390363 [Tanacetum coccineum]